MTTRHYLFICLSLLLLSTGRTQGQMPVKKDIKQTKEEWLQSLPEKTRDSIVYKEWKESRSEQEKKETEATQARIDQALADPHTSYLDISSYPGTELDPRIASLHELRKIRITRSRRLDLYKLFDLLARLPDLHVLVLTDGGYSALPSNIGNLTALDSFDFKNSNIKSLPETFTRLQRLSYLDLEHNAYLYDDDLYDKLRQMNVKTLDLSACGLLEISASIGDVRSLTTLDLSINDIKELPASIGQLTSLQRLYLSQNANLNLVTTATTLSHITTLTALYLDQCGLVSLPAEIGTITSLRVLSIRENVLTALPPTITSLTSLEELYVGSPHNAFRINVIQNLPFGFGNLKKLRILDLSGNQLTSLGNDFGQLTALERLDLSRNQLPEFPISLTVLTALRFIDLNGNRISLVPDGVGGLSLLDSLFLDGDFFNKADKKIAALPDDICSLKNLKKLTLKDNVITYLPACIGGITSLTALDLRGNLITALPASFPRLARLQSLDLKSNDLQSLPVDFAELHALTDLNIAMNINADFTAVVGILSHVHSLRLLDISYNNLTRTQLQPLIDALPACKILNIDYYNKSPLPTNTTPAHGTNYDETPKRNKK